MATIRQHLEAVVALMGGETEKAFSLAGLEQYKKDHTGNLPPAYNEVHVMERLPAGPRRTSLPSQTQQMRVLIRSVGGPDQTGYNNAQEMRARAAELHEAALTVAGQTYYIERSVTDDPIGPDSGWFSGTSEFTY